MRVAPALLAASTLPLSLAAVNAQRAQADEAAIGFGSAPAPGASVLTLRRESNWMVHIGAGRAVIGSTADEVVAAAASCKSEDLAHRCDPQTFANELGQRSLDLPAFWLDRLEVRVSEYERCVALGRCRPAAYENGGKRFEEPNNPVSFVAWDDAQTYCRFMGKRLPTEAEYERAARGSEGRIFPWGNLYNARAANHGAFASLPIDESDGYAELSPVGSFPAGRTKDNILDLAGNVAEWQADAYRERYDDPPPEAGDRVRRVVRGGSYTSGAAWLRGAARDGAPPETRRPDLGFRCARSAEPGKTE